MRTPLQSDWNNRQKRNQFSLEGLYAFRDGGIGPNLSMPPMLAPKKESPLSEPVPKPDPTAKKKQETIQIGDQSHLLVSSAQPVNPVNMVKWRTLPKNQVFLQSPKHKPPLQSTNDTTQTPTRVLHIPGKQLSQRINATIFGHPSKVSLDVFQDPTAKRISVDSRATVASSNGPETFHAKANLTLHNNGQRNVSGSFLFQGGSKDPKKVTINVGNVLIPADPSPKVYQKWPSEVKIVSLFKEGWGFFGNDPPPLEPIPIGSTGGGAMIYAPPPQLPPQKRAWGGYQIVRTYKDPVKGTVVTETSIYTPPAPGGIIAKGAPIQPLDQNQIEAQIKAGKIKGKLQTVAIQWPDKPKKIANGALVTHQYSNGQMVSTALTLKDIKDPRKEFILTLDHKGKTLSGSFLDRTSPATFGGFAFSQMPTDIPPAPPKKLPKPPPGNQVMQ